MNEHLNRPHVNRANWHAAIEMSIDGYTVRDICRIMGEERTTGEYAGKPYSPSVVHGWLQRGEREFAPVRKDITEHWRQMSMARLELQWRKLKKKRDAADVGAINAGTRIIKRQCDIMGVDALPAVLIEVMASEQTSAALMILKRVVLDMLPEDKAHEMLAAMEAGLCEYNGEPVPVEAEVKQITKGDTR